MARIFRHTYTALNNKTGERELRTCRRWYIEYVDATGRRHRVPGFKDLVATKRKATELEHDVILVQRGEEPTNKVTPTRTKAVTENLTDFAAYLTAKNDTVKHVTTTTQQIKSILAGIEIKSAAELTRARVEQWLAMKRSAGEFSASTSNSYLRSIRSFVRWLLVEGQLERDPLAGLRVLNVATDRKRIRRALTESELGRLLSATRKSLAIRLTCDAGRANRVYLTGEDRYFLYALAAYTGLRRSELLSLTAASFHLQAKPPTVTIAAGYAKNRQAATLPLPDWLAKELPAWLKGRAGPLWSTAKWMRTADMLKSDLAEAGIVYQDERGRYVDLHSLRITFITNLARSGATLAVAQKLARHSTPDLTANVYTALDMKDLGEAVGRLKKPK